MSFAVFSVPLLVLWRLMLLCRVALWWEVGSWVPGLELSCYHCLLSNVRKAYFEAWGIVAVVIAIENSWRPRPSHSLPPLTPPTDQSIPRPETETLKTAVERMVILCNPSLEAC